MSSSDVFVIRHFLLLMVNLTYIYQFIFVLIIYVKLLWWMSKFIDLPYCIILRTNITN